ncbi:PAS domain S-box protein [Methanoregula sp.]|uniref:PAS domain S-box protein n=1 Tax=Methanoregula sp. TaxID=2052170 RepID=UPI003569E1AE
MYTLLYVDDEPGLLEIGKLFLEQSGQFRVDTITSAPAALALLHSKTYDAIVSDYQMPEMDGIEFLKKVRSSGNLIPFILFTGRGREEVVIQALNEGADFYLQKGGEPKSQFAELSHQIRQSVQQRKAELRIRDLTRREADIINFLPDATLAIDTRGMVIAWNHAMERMTGIRADQILGKGNYEYALPFYHERRPILIDLVLPDAPLTQVKYQNVIRDQKNLTAEVTIPHFNNGKGASLWFVASPLYDTRGTIIGAIESIREITARKRVEEELRAAHEHLTASEEELRSQYNKLARSEGQIRESEERYRNVVEDQTEFISRFLPDGTHVFVNEAYCRYFGLKRDEILGHRFRPKIPADDRERLDRFFTTLTPDHPVDSIEHRIIMPDGTIRWQRWSDRAIFDPSGTITEHQSVGRDITEEKATEAVLEESEKRLNSIYNTVGDSIFQLAVEPCEQYRFTSVNSAFSKLTGLSYDQVIGRMVNEIIPGSSLDLDLGKFRQAIKEKTIVRWEETYHYSSGQIFGEVSVAPIFDAAGSCTYLIGSVHDISGRKQAEEALSESNEKFQTLYTHMTEGVALHELVYNDAGVLEDYIIIETNPAFEKLLGISRDAVLGKTSREAYGVTEPPYLEIYARVSLTGTPEVFETYFSPMDKYFLISAYCTSKGRFATIFEDITVRKRADEELLRNEALYRSIITAIPDGIAITDVSGVVSLVSPAMLKIFGVEKKEEVVGKPVDMFLVPEDRERARANIALMQQGVFTGPGEYRALRAGKTMLDIEANAEFVKDEKGDPTGLVFVVRDLTGRKRVEAALKESKERYRDLIETTSDWIWEIDKNGKYTYVSPKIRDILGYKPEEVIGKTPFDLMIPGESEKVAGIFNKYVITQKPFSGLENINLHKDGRHVVFETSGIPFFDDGHALLGFRGIDRDITNRKQADEALRQANKKLNLLSSITRHDINNLLTMLQGYLFLMDMKRSDPKFPEYFEKARTVAERIAVTIRFTKEYESIGVKAPLWQDCLTLIDRAAQQVTSGKVKVINDLPAGTEMFCDPLVEKVFYNLIDNAIRYGGTKMTKIRFFSKETDDGLILACEDDGAGVSVEDKKHLFEKGFGKNTGLGLFLSREILSITGITITETGIPGKGARFEITVPKGAYRFSDIPVKRT